MHCFIYSLFICNLDCTQNKLSTVEVRTFTTTKKLWWRNTHIIDTTERDDIIGIIIIGPVMNTANKNYIK